MRIVPTGGVLGARVEGIDLGQVLEATMVADLLAALGRHGVLCFPGQSLDPAALAAFGARFGPLEINVASGDHHVRDHPEVMILSNITVDGKPVGLPDAGQGWHTDVSYRSRIALATILHAKTVPVRDGAVLGATEFRDMHAAYDDLDPGLKARLEGLTAIHDFAKFWDMMRARPGSRRKPLNAAQQERSPPVPQPIVRVHPVTGRKVLYCNPGYATQVVGMDAAEGAALLDALFRHQAQEKFLWRHRWSAGDVLMWDDIGTTHNAIADHRADEPRLMHRIQVMAPAVGARPSA